MFAKALVLAVIVLGLIIVSQHYVTAKIPIPLPTKDCNNFCQYEKVFLAEALKRGVTANNFGFVEVDADGNWTGDVLDSGMTSETKALFGIQIIPFQCSDFGTYSLIIQKQTEGGILHVKVVKEGTILKEGTTTAPFGIVQLAGQC